MFKQLRHFPIHILIFLFVRYYSSHSTLGILHVSLVTRDNMHVNMKDRLPCGFVDVDTNIVTIGMISLVNFPLYILKHYIHCFSLMVSEVEVRCNMTFGDNQCMTWRNRITIIERHASGCFTNHLHSS